MTNWEILSVICTLSIIVNGVFLQRLWRQRRAQGNQAQTVYKLKQTISYNERRIADTTAKLLTLEGEIHQLRDQLLRTSILTIGLETARNHELVHGCPIEEIELYHQIVTCIMGSRQPSLQKEMLAMLDMDATDRIFISGYGHLLTTKEECEQTELCCQPTSAKM